MPDWTRYVEALYGNRSNRPTPKGTSGVSLFCLRIPWTLGDIRLWLGSSESHLHFSVNPVFIRSRRLHQNLNILEGFALIFHTYFLIYVHEYFFIDMKYFIDIY